jgi:hypothetical protein
MKKGILVYFCLALLLVGSTILYAKQNNMEIKKAHSNQLYNQKINSDKISSKIHFYDSKILDIQSKLSEQNEKNLKVNGIDIAKNNVQGASQISESEQSISKFYDTQLKLAGNIS